MAASARTRRPSARGACAAHRSGDAALLVSGELQNVIDEKPCVVFVIALKRRRRRSGKDPMIVLALEEAGRHGSARANSLRIDHPAFHPVGLEPAAGLKEVWRRRDAVVPGIAGGVALQARRGGAAEEAARHFSFFGS